MNKLTKLKQPPARPDFNREETRFIGLGEMQKKDPTLKPKKEKQPTPLIGIIGILLVVASLISLKMFWRNTSLTPPHLSAEVKKESNLATVNFVPPKPNPYQDQLVDAPALVLEPAPERTPANYEEGYFAEDSSPDQEMDTDNYQDEEYLAE